MDNEKKEKSFVIKDKRAFTDSGDRRDSGPVTPDEEKEVKQELHKHEDVHGHEEFFQMNFSNFVISLGTSVIYHFGDIPDPVTKQSHRNLPAARQTIDILGILQEKTRGNLDNDEKKLLEDLLYELRMRYIKEKDKG